MSWSDKLAKLARLLLSPGGRRGLLQGVAMTVEHRRALSGLTAMTVLDVGANKGQFALLAAELFPAARIHAFEPLPEAAERLRTLFADEPRLRVHEKALGQAQETATLHVARRADSSSLLPIGQEQVRQFPGTEEVATRPVAVTRAEALFAPGELLPPVLLKIDVQGGELAALQGFGALLPGIAHVYVECSYRALYEGQALAAEVEAFLAAAGFVQVGRYNLARDAAGQPVQADLLFSRPETATPSRT